MIERFVYFIRPMGFPDRVKIGCSQMPRHRLESLLTWSPFPLEIVATIPGSYDLERNIHDCLVDLHSHREWFIDDGRIAAIIDRLRAGAPIGDAMDLSARSTTLSKKRLYWNQNPEGRLRCSYSMRLGWAARRLSRSDPDAYYSVPDDIELIQRRWSKDGRKGENRTPTPAEFARMDMLLADPAKHCIRHVVERKRAA